MVDEFGRGRGVGPSLDVALKNAHDSLTPVIESTMRRSLVVAFGMTSGGFTGAQEYYVEVVEIP